MRFNRSFTRSIVSLSFPVLFLIVAFARPALAQSDQDASPDKTKTPVSKLSVSPTTLSYSVNLDRKVTSKLTETKHFNIANKGTLPMSVTVGAPSGTNYTIIFPPEVSPAGGTLTLPGSISQEVDVEFIPHGPATDDGTIAITSGATSGKKDATVNLKGKSTQEKPTPTATATATATVTATATATTTPTVTATATATVRPTPKPEISGHVMSGANPVSNSIVTMWAAGMTGYGTGAIQFPFGTTTTGADGSFFIGSVCPSANSQVYLTAQGGNAGGGSNSSLMMMAVVGQCNTIFPSNIAAVINELTTVAAQWALAQFTDSTGENIGAPSSNATGLVNAFNQAQANLAATSTGTPASFWSGEGATAATCTGGSPPVNCDGLERMDTIANLLAACVESSGPSSSACVTLLSNTGGSTTTLAAAHEMATNPVGNVSALFAIQGASPPYAPALSAGPDGWEIALNFDPGGVLSGQFLLAIDAAGNVWVPNYAGNSVTELTPSGGLAGNFAPAGANFNGLYGVAIDAAGNVWVTNYLGNSASELIAGCSNSSCTGLNFNYANTAGAGFYNPSQMAIDASGNVWVANPFGYSVTELLAGCTSSSCTAENFNNSNTDGANFYDPTGVAIDASGNVWVANPFGYSVTELTSSGHLAGNFNSYTFDIPDLVAIDAAGNAWVTNYSGNSVTELTSSGGLAGNFDPGGANFNNPNGMAIDAAGNVWVTNIGGNSVTELTSSGGLAGNFAPSGANFNLPDGVAIDGSGNVWIANEGGSSVAEIVGAARPVLTPVVACLNRTPPAAVCLP